jgi:hypothetical protein
MIKRLLLLILLCSPAFGQWTEVQKAWNSTAGSSPATTTVSLPGVASGDTVVVSVMYLGTATGFTMAVTDGNGHSFTASTSSPCTYVAGEKVWMFYLINTPGASMTVTATPSVAHGISVHAVEFAPPAGTSVSFDTDSCAVPTLGTTPVTSPSITPAGNSLLYAGIIADPSGTGSVSAVGGSWTLGTNGTIASDTGNTADEYQTGATGATVVSFSVTGSSGSGWDAMALSIKAVSTTNVYVKGKVITKGTIIFK